MQSTMPMKGISRSLALALRRKYSSTSASFPGSLPSKTQMNSEIKRRFERMQEEGIKQERNRDLEKELLNEVDSIASVMLLETNAAKYPSFVRKREKLRKQMEWRESEKQAKMPSSKLPLSVDSKPRFFTALPEQHSTWMADEKATEKSVEAERGFFVTGDNLYDEYESAAAVELPESEMNELPFTFHGYEDEPLEQMQFQFPGQQTRSMKPKAWKPAEETPLGEIGIEYDKYGAEGDSSVAPSTSAKCSGCGAGFHCNSSSLPGFVPIQLFEEIEHNVKRKPVHQKTDYLCRRCFLQKEYKFLLNVNVCNVDYEGIMGHLKLVQEALIILVVDMADLQGSIHRALPNIIGDQKPMIVVGNKIDLLPPDAEHGYLKRYHDSLRMAVKDAGFSARFNILKYFLVSAKTGYGIEDLITNIYTRWISARGSLRSNIYVVGCTNAGKSTLFNAFLQSDLCMVRAMDLVERVTTSIWPGTTLSLLKFPMWNPTPHKMEMRREKLRDYHKWRSMEKNASEELYRQTRDPKYLSLQGYIGSTFKEMEDENQPVSVDQTEKEFYGEIEPEYEPKKTSTRLSLNDPVFQRGTNWCHDTPGTVNEQQILNLLTLEELINVIPRRLIVPRTFIAYGGKSLLLGGIGRVDLISAERRNNTPDAVFISVFVSDQIPVKYINTVDVDDFLERNFGDPALGAPIGGEERLKTFPKLQSKTFEISSLECSGKKATADVLLSSLGWVAITSKAHRIKLDVWTPDGRGIQLREPIMPFVASLRGKRIGDTAEYKTILPPKIEESIYWRGDVENKYIYAPKSPEEHDSLNDTDEVNFDLA